MRYLKTLLILWLAALFWTGSAHASTETRTASGYGDSPQQAVANALVEAARQGLGVIVTVDPAFRNAVHEWVVREGFATGRWHSEPEVQMPTRAAVEGYRVLSTRQIQDGLWQAEVEARLLTHTPVGPDRSHLPSIAIGTFRTDSNQYTLGEAVPAAQVRQQLRSALVTGLAQSDRFRVLDRDFNAALESERTLSAGSLLPQAQLQQGRAMGADLMLVGEIQDFQLGRPGRTYYGMQRNNMEPVIRIHYRVIDTASGEILRADTLRYQEQPGELRRRLLAADIDPDREPERIGEFLFPDVAAVLAGEVNDTLYPIRVLASEGERVYLSQGAGRLVNGALFSVHDTGRNIEDPDTGLNIRLESAPRATLRVTHVQPGYGEAEVIDGSASAVNVDAILRPAYAAPARGPGRPMTPGSSEAPLTWD